MIKEREKWKDTARQLALVNIGKPASKEQVEAWNKYKKIRNTINNKKRNEEKEYKAKKVLENIHSPEKTWRTAKEFMEWKKQGPPQQLQVGNKLVTSAMSVAEHINSFFLEKVLIIREGLKKVPPSFDMC